MLLILCMMLIGAFGLTCDIPTDAGSRAACIASCKVQNCATGYCEERGGENICVCSRCDDGHGIP